MARLAMRKVKLLPAGLSTDRAPRAQVAVREPEASTMVNRAESTRVWLRSLLSSAGDL